MELKVGNWIAITDDGLWLNIFGDDEPSFQSKSELIKSIAGARLDEAKRPRVTRLGVGKYIYYPKCDGQYIQDGYYIVRLTKDNISEYKKMYEEQLNNRG